MSTTSSVFSPQKSRASARKRADSQQAWQPKLTRRFSNRFKLKTTDTLAGKVRAKLREECAARQADTDALRQVVAYIDHVDPLVLSGGP